MIDQRLCRWNRTNFQGDGILVGADVSQEYLLPWWWDHYSRHNSFPVTWIDFGLSEQMKDWCREKGELISLKICSELFMATQDEVSIKENSDLPFEIQIRPKYINPFQEDSDLWKARHIWFKKPFALLQSPYKRSIWLDCDCEIRGNIKELFDYCSIQ